MPSQLLRCLCPSRALALGLAVLHDPQLPLPRLPGNALAVGIVGARRAVEEADGVPLVVDAVVPLAVPLAVDGTAAPLAVDALATAVDALAAGVPRDVDAGVPRDVGPAAVDVPRDVGACEEPQDVREGLLALVVRLGACGSVVVQDLCDAETDGP